ncbi:MAG TPA: choice-of-anchor B family protein [Gemmatimonadales bacterium]|nr:choice-of-anchor B family protein [Gemmatimonadales bacterium]
MSHPKAALSALAVLLVAACGSDAAPTPAPTPDNVVASVTIDGPTALTFQTLGRTRTLAATARNAAGDAVSGATITWTRSSTSVVSVGSDGTVTALANGTATVTANVLGKTASVEVTVAQVPAGLTLTSPSQTLSQVGAATQLTATVTDSNQRAIPGQAITWESSDQAVLRVNAQGVASALREGTAIITARAGTRSQSLPFTVAASGPVGGSLLGTARPCTGGSIGPFPCTNVTLLAYLPHGAFGAPNSVTMNDIWGWTDPQTGKEIAIALRNDGAVFIDVSTPTAPVYLGWMPIPPGATPNAWHDVKVYQNHAFVVADGAGQHGMQVFDLARLRAFDGVPQEYQADVIYRGVASVHNIAINEATGRAYLVGSNAGGTSCAGGLHMVNIQQPKNPVFAGCFNEVGTGRSGNGYTHDTQCVIYSGPDATHQGREICFLANETHVVIADVTAGSAPKALGKASYPNVRYTHQGWLSADQRYFYVNDELDEGAGVPGTRTLIWDVSNLDDPILVKQDFGPTTATDHNLYIRGTRLFSSNYQYGLRVLDISNPTSPVQVAHLDTAPTSPNTPGYSGTWSNYPFFASGIVVMTSSKEGFFVLRVE